MDYCLPFSVKDRLLKMILKKIDKGGKNFINIKEVYCLVTKYNSIPGVDKITITPVKLLTLLQFQKVFPNVPHLWSPSIFTRELVVGKDQEPKSKHEVRLYWNCDRVFLKNNGFSSLLYPSSTIDKITKKPTPSWILNTYFWGDRISSISSSGRENVWCSAVF
jgi:hypothetical protein